METRKPKTLDREGLWNYAVRALAVRATSTGELREKLRHRAQQESDVDEALVRLKDLGYLNDERFAEAFAQNRLNNDRLGKARVVRDLRARRVAPELAERVAGETYSGVDEDELINDWLRRKFRATPQQEILQDEKAIASAYRGLVRHGFRSGAILAALKRVARNPEALEILTPPEACDAEW